MIGILVSEYVSQLVWLIYQNTNRPIIMILSVELPYTLCVRVPTSAEYCAISSAVGQQDDVNHEAVQIALRHSHYAVVVAYQQETIGMGRIIGDGAIFFYIQDVAVKPAHQGRGVGTAIIHHLLEYIHTTAPDKAFIGLFAAPNTTRFYERFGFLSNLGITGMYQVHSP